VHRVALGLDHVARHGRLVAVLAAAHVEEVVRSGVDRLPQARPGQLEPEPAPLAPRAQHRDVAAVGIDVHQLGVERADAQRRGHGSFSSITTTLPT
jgi:hypothetical protein